MIIDEPGQYNFTIYQGATLEKTITLKDNNGAAINLTGYTIRMQARKNINTAATLFDLSIGSGITVTAPATLGEFVISLTATQTTALFFDTAIYDIELTSGTEIARALIGTITLAKEVTR